MAQEAVVTMASSSPGSTPSLLGQIARPHDLRKLSIDQLGALA